MAMERNANSVLAKLMGIERPSLPHNSHGRRRVLSENYLQNISLVTHRERSPLDFYDYEDEFTMVVEGNLESEDIIQLSEGASVNGGNSCVKIESGEARFLSQDQRSDVQLEWFDLRGSASSFSELGHMSKLSSSCASALKKQRPSEPWIWQAKSWQNMETGSSPSKGIVELNMQNSKSHPPGRSFSLPSSPSGGKKQSISSCVRSKRTNSQGRKKKSLYNGVESPMRDFKSAQGIAKQVTSQVKDSIWHRFTDISKSVTRSDETSANEHEDIIMYSSSCLSSSENEHGSPSTKPVTISASQEAQKTKKEFSERWGTRRSTRETRTFSGNSATRYLSKPTLFPSAWVPRSTTRDLNLNRSWCLRPEKSDSLQCNNSSRFDLNGPSLNSGEYDIKKEALATQSDSENVEESNMLEEISSALDSFSERSPFSDVESPTYHDALMTMNETGDKRLVNQLSQEGSCGSTFNCDIVPPSLDNEDVVDEGIEKMGTCIKLQREQLSSEASKCILEDRGSSLPEFCLKHQVKDNTSFEPRSPVSSLEGPEACRCRPNSMVESNQISSFPNFIDNNIHGLQAKLEPIDTISLESSSEGHEMVVSSDGDNEDGSVGGYREDAQILKLYNTSENRDFSYLIDVLSESGFPTLNMERESEAWRSHGYVLNPLVFDSLEKKYGKQTFWERAERKLLFDRMNSGLMEIARSLDPINIRRRKTLAKRFFPAQNQEFIEEELWALLVKQEEESKRRSSNKVCIREMEWLEVEAYTYLVVKEIESLLLDELVEEFVSMVV